MKICSFFHGILFNDKIILKPSNPNDWILIRKMFKSKVDREKRSEKEILLKCEIDAAFQKRTFKQLSAVWKLVEVIFMTDSENNRLPTSTEKYELYLDLLEIYGDKRPNRFKKDVLQPIHLSESKTIEAAHFIDGLLYHLSTLADIPIDLQATVRSVLYDWEIWRGKQVEDINDNRSLNNMREQIRYSEASGEGGNIEFAHIVSRGSDKADIDESWNLLALTDREHRLQHQKGWDYFLQQFPHLKGRVQRAREKAKKLYKDYCE